MLIKICFFDVSVLTFERILRSNTASQITPFSRECFLRQYEGQFKTAIEQEVGEKIDWKR